MQSQINSAGIDEENLAGQQMSSQINTKRPDEDHQAST